MSVNANAVVNQQQVQCRYCEAEILENSSTCPECGKWLRSNPKRKSRNRPQPIYQQFIDSNSMNGQYIIGVLPDKSTFCTCQSHLRNIGTEKIKRIVTCKHVRRHLSNSISDFDSILFRPPTSYQINILKKMGVQNPEEFTNDQAYFTISYLLKLQGVKPYAVKNIAQSSIQEYEELPAYTFGTEIECYIKHSDDINNRSDLSILLGDIVDFRDEHYNHELRPHWKAVYDATINSHAPKGYFPVELVSRKLYAAPGLEEVYRVCEKINNHGDKVNVKCGLHIHIDAYGMTERQIFTLCRAWARIEHHIIAFLVSRSRVAGTGYCDNFNENYLKTIHKQLEQDPRKLDYFDPESNVSTSLYSYIENNRTDSSSRMRYYSLNIFSLGRHKTIEFRKHQGTTDASKIAAWVIMCLKIVEKIKQGVKYDDFPIDSIENFLDFLGIHQNNISPFVKQAREKLVERFYHFKEVDSERDNNIRLNVKRSVEQNPWFDKAKFDLPDSVVNEQESEPAVITENEPESEPAIIVDEQVPDSFQVPDNFFVSMFREDVEAIEALKRTLSPYLELNSRTSVENVTGMEIVITTSDDSYGRYLAYVSRNNSERSEKVSIEFFSHGRPIIRCTCGRGICGHKKAVLLKYFKAALQHINLLDNDGYVIPLHHTENVQRESEQEIEPQFCRKILYWLTKQDVDGFRLRQAVHTMIFGYQGLPTNHINISDMSIDNGRCLAKAYDDLTSHELEITSDNIYCTCSEYDMQRYCVHTKALLEKIGVGEHNIHEYIHPIFGMDNPSVEYIISHATINNSDEAVMLNHDDEATKVLVESSTSNNRYVVTIRENDVSCDCVGFRTRGYCRHSKLALVSI